MRLRLNSNLVFLDKFNAGSHSSTRRLYTLVLLEDMRARELRVRISLKQVLVGRGKLAIVFLKIVATMRREILDYQPLLQLVGPFCMGRVVARRHGTGRATLHRRSSTLALLPAL